MSGGALEVPEGKAVRLRSYGGAILAIVQGGLVPMTSLALTDCDVSANESGDLGGICTQGGTRLSITGSAISGN